MLTFTTEELNQIMLGLCGQVEALRHSIHVTRDLPEVCTHWQLKMKATEAAYLKVQAQYLRQSAEELRLSLQGYLKK